jgi:hypothetical protein
MIYTTTVRFNRVLTSNRISHDGTLTSRGVLEIKREFMYKVIPSKGVIIDIEHMKIVQKIVSNAMNLCVSKIESIVTFHCPNKDDIIPLHHHTPRISSIGHIYNIDGIVFIIPLKTIKPNSSSKTRIILEYVQLKHAHVNGFQYQCIAEYC